MMALLQKLLLWISSFDDESDYFRPMGWFLVIGGIHLESSNRLVRFLFALYRALLTIQFFIWADRVYVALFEWDSPGELIGVITFFLAVVMILGRVGLIRLYLKELQAVRSYMGGLLNHHPEQRSENRNRSYRLVRRTALVMEVTFFVDQIALYLFGVFKDRLYETPANLRRLGWEFELFVKVINASNHFLYASLHTTILTVLNSVMMAFQTELDEIVGCYADLFERVDRKLQETKDDERDIHFLKVLKFELKTTVVRHNQFLKQLNSLKSFFKFSFLVMFYMNVVVLACAGYYVKSQGVTTNSFIVSSYLGSHILECYWFSRLAEKLNAANAEIGHTIYNSKWTERLRYDSAANTSKDYREIRASLLVIMAKAQRNLGISSGGLFEMSIEAFGTLVQLIYNFMMFLIKTAK